jgi:hypothetical protein
MNFKFKNKITRKEFKKYQGVLYKGARSTASGELDQSSMLHNIEEQKDELILLHVELVDDKKMTPELLEELSVEEYEKIHEKCAVAHEKLTEKKS